MTDIQGQIEALNKDIWEKKQELSKLRRQREPEPVTDYDLTRSDGTPIKLSELFGDKQDLILIHNMGKGCAYCTMWADGFESELLHLKSRAAFVVVSPDAPDVQKAFAESRGWSFPMVSAKGTSFIKNMGFADDKHVMPGVSAFYKAEDGKLYRTNKDFFGPYDDYSAPWHLFDLLKGGADDWQPKFDYV